MLAQIAIRVEGATFRPLARARGFSQSIGASSASGNERSRWRGLTREGQPELNGVHHLFESNRLTCPVVARQVSRVRGRGRSDASDLAAGRRVRRPSWPERSAGGRP